MRAIRLSLLLIVASLALYGLAVGKSLLIPLVLAIFFWYLITSLSRAVQRLPVGGRTLPTWVSFPLALLVIALLAAGVVNITSRNITQVVKAAPSYEANLNLRVAEGFAWAGADEPPNLDRLLEQVDLSGLIAGSARALAGLLGDAGLVVVYLFFLFIEAQFFDKKLDALFPRPERRQRAAAVLGRIGEEIRTYVGVKSAVSLLTAGLSYGVMLAVGLDYAEFWALLIFIFNFIPNIGSLTATLLPSLLALVQFPGWRPFAIVAGGVTAAQLLVANVVEPRVMSGSLNLSPLVIILSLVLWGTLWGVAGMFLCVPLMVVLMIVLANFPQTRPVAILLSRDGRLRS